MNDGLNGSSVLPENSISSDSSALQNDQKRSSKYLTELYRVYEFDDGLYFPDMKFRCGNIGNYVKTGILSEAEADKIWKENATLK